MIKLNFVRDREKNISKVKNLKFSGDVDTIYEELIDIIEEILNQITKVAVEQGATPLSYESAKYMIRNRFICTLEIKEKYKTKGE